VAGDLKRDRWEFYHGIRTLVSLAAVVSLCKYPVEYQRPCARSLIVTDSEE